MDPWVLRRFLLAGRAHLRLEGHELYLRWIGDRYQLHSRYLTFGQLVPRVGRRFVLAGDVPAHFRRLAVDLDLHSRYAQPVLRLDVALTLLACGRCGQPLADEPEARRTGIGPDCRLKAPLDPFYHLEILED